MIRPSVLAVCLGGEWLSLRVCGYVSLALSPVCLRCVADTVGVGELGVNTGVQPAGVGAFSPQSLRVMQVVLPPVAALGCGFSLPVCGVVRIFD